MRERTDTVRTQGDRPSPGLPRFFQLISPNPGIDFVRVAPRVMLVSWVIVLMGLGSMYLRGGLNYGIDFAGGRTRRQQHGGDQDRE